MSHKHLTEYLMAGTIMANGGIVQVPLGSFWKFGYQNLHLMIVQVPYEGFSLSKMKFTFGIRAIVLN